MSGPVAVTGRVLSARPRVDGSYAITLGPGPHVYWFTAPEPYTLGSEVYVEARGIAERRKAKYGTQEGSFSVLAGAKAQRTAPAARVVAPEWLERVAHTMMRPLRPYQIEGAGWVASRLAAGRGAILADDPGIGKSSQAIAALVATGLFPAIVVCPTSVKANWPRELYHSVVPLAPTVVMNRRRPIPPADVVVVSYELLRHRERDLLELGARVIVFDEAQALKEPHPSPMHRAAVATRLAHWIGRAVLLTGTPILNRPAELWRLLHIVDPRAWPSYEDYQRRYCQAPAEDEPDDGKRIVTSYGRAEHVDELQARVSSVMLRRLKKDVLKDMPPKSRRSLLVELDTLDMQLYKRAETEFVAWLREHGISRPTNRTEQLAKLNYLRQIAALGKLRHAVPEYLRAWFSEGRERDPMVVWAFHRRVIEGLFRIAGQLGLQAVGILGGDEPQKRQQAVDLFNAGGAELFIASIGAASEGINLQSASDALFVERVWVPSRLMQAEDREHRLGQQRPVQIVYMDAAGTIDERIAEVLDAKAMLIGKLVDGATRRVEAFAVADSVTQMYLAAGAANDRERQTA